jgi:hypothetical protein
MQSFVPLTLLSAMVVVEHENHTALFAALLEAAEHTDVVFSPFPLTEALQEHLKLVWGWEAEVDNATGNIVTLTPTRDAVQVPAMEVMLNMFAPFVKAMQPPCHITYREHSGNEVYRYVLDGQTVRKQRALLHFVDASEQREGAEDATLHQLTDDECYTTAQMIIHASGSRNILAFLEAFYEAQAHTFRISLVEQKGRYDVCAVQVYDQRNQEIFPALHLPYWRQALANDPHFFEGCDGMEAMLEVIYDHLYHDDVYLEYSIPVQETMGKLLVSDLHTAYPVLYRLESL